MLAIHVPTEKSYTYMRGKNKANVVKNNIMHFEFIYSFLHPNTYFLVPKWGRHTVFLFYGIQKMHETSCAHECLKIYWCTVDSNMLVYVELIENE